MAEFGLREIKREDIPIINKWRNDNSLINMLGAPYRYINQEVDKLWFDEYMTHRGNTVRCAITEKGNDDILGLISLTGVDYLNQCAELHIMIGNEENQGRGIGTYAVNAMIKHAFDNMNLHRLELSVLSDNKRAIHLYEKCGFVYEGCLRKSRYKNGKFVDMLLYAIIKDE